MVSVMCSIRSCGTRLEPIRGGGTRAVAVTYRLELAAGEPAALERSAGAMEYTQILYEPQDAVAVVTLNRPEYRNPIGRICIEELDDAFSRAVKDDAIRVIVLRAEGQHFSAGHDLGTPAKLKDDAERPYPPGA